MAKATKKDEKESAATPGPVPVQFLTKAQIRERREKGDVQAIVTFEVVGRPKEHVESALKSYMENIHKDSRIRSIREEFAEAIATGDGFFSTFCELEAMIKGLETLVWISVNFSPASIEILEPETLTVHANELTSWLNDLISKLHEVGISYRNESQKVVAMNEALNALITNLILTRLEIGPSTPDDLQARMGVHKKQLEPFLEHLVKKERIVKLGTSYKLK